MIQAAIRADHAWKVIVGGRIVGYGIVSHNFFGRSFLEMIYIQADQRSKGFGPALIRFLEGKSQSKDLFTSTNESNTHMQHVLSKLGYVSSGAIYNLDPGDPELVYVKNL